MYPKYKNSSDECTNDLPCSLKIPFVRQDYDFEPNIQQVEDEETGMSWYSQHFRNRLVLISLDGQKTLI